MARIKTTQPNYSRHKGQRSQSLPLFLQRIVPLWQRPGWFDGKMWRAIVEHQPFAMDCREALVGSMTSLEWKIEARDSTQRDELKSEIDYYTSFFENTGEYDYIQLLEWLVADLLDMPFGAAFEVGREGDKPEGKVLWIEPLDGATLFPSLNFEYPVGQMMPENATRVVYFPKHAINRVYMSPRTDIKRKGWGMCPPEKIYLALELLNRGDKYYADLLLDTPEAGILDLGDMAQASAEEWVESWRDMLAGIDPFKIPVLYEHEKPANWIAFTRNPTEIMFDKAILKYAALVAAGYGLSLSDVGIQAVASGGETLAGSIRQERKTRRTGFARLKKKITLFFNRMLPETLEFKFIDMDDELSVALGRARLANATAWQQLVEMRAFSPQEARQQMIADGLTTISLPEEVPPDSEFPENTNGNNPDERPGLLGRQVAPSDGGHGEVVPRSELFEWALNNDLSFRARCLERESSLTKYSDEENNEFIKEINDYLNNVGNGASLLDVTEKLGDNT